MKSYDTMREQPRDDSEHRAMIATADLLAKILDTTVKIPRTSFYLGLDPLLGLIPGVGDLLANLLGTVILGLAARLHVPRIVLARMSLNVLINGAIGAIPIVGDLFSFWFRSHARNAKLLKEAVAEPRATSGDWLYVTGIIGGTVVLLLLAVAGIVWIGAKLWRYFAA